MIGADNGGTENIHIDQTSIQPFNNSPTPLFDICQRFQSFLKLTHNSQVLGAAECVERFLHGDFTLVAARGGVAGDLEDQTVGPGQEVVVMAPWHHTGLSCSLPSEMTEGRF